MEREKKFLLEHSLYLDLVQGKFGFLEVYSLGTPLHVERSYIFFDTPDFALLNAGVTTSIRFRPPQYVLTIKAPLVPGNSEERLEYQSIVDSTLKFSIGMPFPAIPNPGIVLPPLPNGVKLAQLQGTVITHVVNTRIPINYDGRYVLELDVSLCSGTDGRSVPAEFHEAEIELENGTLEDLTRFSTRFKTQFGLQEIRLNKYQRMMAELNLVNAIYNKHNGDCSEE